MADTPAFVSGLINDPEKAKAAVELVHPVYGAHADSWQVLIDAYEGDGGFLTGSYLWPYPAENEDEFEKRRKQARYHNYLESLVDLYTRFLFSKGVDRQSTNDELNAWLDDVDGQQTSMTEHMKKFASLALVSGHAGTLVDKTPDEPTGPSKADEQGRVVASVFTSLAIPDWRFSPDGLEAVKLIEAGKTPSIAEDFEDASEPLFLFWDKTGWARFNSEGEFKNAQLTDLGLVPFVILRPKPSYLDQMIGRPLISNANIVRAMFNRGSEEDTAYRTSAFSLLTVAVPLGGDVNLARESIGGEVGNTRAVVTTGDINFKTPDQAVPAGIRENIAYLVREMYRAAHVRFVTDSKVGESGDSIRLNFTELNEMLQGFGKSLEQAEQQMVRAWFAWTSATPEQAQAAYEAAEYEASYPDEFINDELMVELEAWAEALRMGLGDTMNRRIKRAVVRRIDPNIPQEELDKIDGEIEAMKAEDLMGDPSVGVDRGDPEGRGIAEAENAAA